MKKFFAAAYTLGALGFFSCYQDPGTEQVDKNINKTQVVVTETKSQVSDELLERKNASSDSLPDFFETLPDSVFVELNPLSNLFAFDMKYATADNFLGEKVYDCPKCLLRSVVARALIKASGSFKEKGYTIKFFDCFRPLYIQKRMWDIKPDSRYVANPNKSGSIHNRGAAVDITLVDAEGKELDMGTTFDHFGEEAHHAYTQLPQNILDNRKLLKEIMEKAGFKAQNSEWWHYSYIGSGQFPLSDEAIRCED